MSLVLSFWYTKYIMPQLKCTKKPKRFLLLVWVMVIIFAHNFSCKKGWLAMSLLYFFKSEHYIQTFKTGWPQHLLRKGEMTISFGIESLLWDDPKRQDYRTRTFSSRERLVGWWWVVLEPWHLAMLMSYGVQTGVWWVSRTNDRHDTCDKCRWGETSI